ncbi:MAG: transglutaminase-like cysteine peptidase [Gammaproteobacteria bacterium]
MPVAKKFLLILICIGLTTVGLLHYEQRNQQQEPEPSATLTLDPPLLEKIEEKYGLDVKQRFLEWQNLMESKQPFSDLEKLRLANDFFNQHILFGNDQILWQKNDYWATPFELLVKGAGDCEDFSIAKYFTLREMGVDDAKLRITYVKAVTLNQAHMVVTYFESPHAIPLVLDNIKPTIDPANERTDLEPVYSFNGSGLWLAKMKDSGHQIGSARKLNPWADLKRRMLTHPFQ